MNENGNPADGLFVPLDSLFPENEHEVPDDELVVSLDALNAELKFFLSENEGVEVANTHPSELLDMIYEWLVYEGWTNEDFPGFVKLLNSSDDWLANSGHQERA